MCRLKVDHIASEHRGSTDGRHQLLHRLMYHILYDALLISEMPCIKGIYFLFPLGSISCSFLNVVIIMTAFYFTRKKRIAKKVNDLVLLTPMQERFCLEYAKSGNQRQAYIKAGYKAKNENAIDAAASRLLRNVKVQERLAEIAKEVEKDAIADISEMQSVLTKIIRQQAEEEVIVVESDGVLSKAKKMNKSAAIKDVINAINTLGKMQGAFVDKTDINIVAPIVLTDDIKE